MPGNAIENVPAPASGPAPSSGAPADLPPSGVRIVTRRIAWKRLVLALGVAAVSDAISFVVTLIAPVQWAVDAATAGCLFLILGRRWALLPGLVAEAIPGLGVFPVWILVVLAIFFYDDVQLHKAQLRRRPS